MNENKDPGYWDELKIKLKKKFPQLGAFDFQHRTGQEEGMMRLIEYKLRMTKEQMKKIIAGL